MQKICHNLLDNEYQLQYYFDKFLVVMFKN